ncbi:COX15/CtaA family protein [Rhizosphaericola mali]|uniref:Heme A synthase n=1 Tax=Rhizosphaericola mali TaxID=2545455 RepID=A0A5P2G3U9_9BACT|nr:COX15/CtaA family protein [Rhizosphaericola mali]QES90514.1 heme A synthase [Rhizosphaericola mali]
MKTNKSYVLYTRVVLFIVFLVILAGSVVRTTHSGMGCPDWPKCFGRWIPPMNAGQLPKDYEKYLSKQDIDHSFNAFHTWVEYINRLCTGILGFAIIALIYWSFKKFYKTKPSIAWLSVFLMVIVIIESILGAMVVYANLAVDTVTIHLFPIFILAGICVLMIHKAQGNYKIQDTSLQWISTLALILVLVQIFIGTQVRESVDIFSKQFEYKQREKWLVNVGNVLTTHEVFAWIAAVACLFLFWKSLNYPRLQKMGFLLLLLVVIEFAMGFTLVKLGFPQYAQPIHLVIGSGILITLFSYRLHFGKNKSSIRKF